MQTFLWHPLTPKCTWPSQNKSKKNSQKILGKLFSVIMPPFTSRGWAYLRKLLYSLNTPQFGNLPCASQFYILSPARSYFTVVCFPLLVSAHFQSLSSAQLCSCMLISSILISTLLCSATSHKSGAKCLCNVVAIAQNKETRRSSVLRWLRNFCWLTISHLFLWLLQISFEILANTRCVPLWLQSHVETFKIGLLSKEFLHRFELYPSLKAWHVYKDIPYICNGGHS